MQSRNTADSDFLSPRFLPFHRHRLHQGHSRPTHSLPVALGQMFNFRKAVDVAQPLESDPGCTLDPLPSLSKLWFPHCKAGDNMLPLGLL